MNRPNWTNEADETANIVNCCYALLGLDIKEVEHLGTPSIKNLFKLPLIKKNPIHTGFDLAGEKYQRALIDKNQANEVLRRKIKKHKQVFVAMKEAAEKCKYLENNTDKTLYPKEILIAGINALRKKISPKPPRSEEPANDLDKSLTALQQCADVTLCNTKIDSSEPNTDWQIIQTGLLEASDIKSKETSDHTEDTGEDSTHENKLTGEVHVPYHNAFPDKACTGVNLHDKYDVFTEQYANLPKTSDVGDERSQPNSLYLVHSPKSSDKSGHTITTQTSYHDQSRTIASKVINPEGLGLQDQLEANIFSAYAYLASNSVNKELPDSLFLNLKTAIVVNHKDKLDNALSSALSKFVDKDKKQTFDVLINGSLEKIEIIGSREKKPSLTSTNENSSGSGITGYGENGGSNRFFSDESKTTPEIQVNQTNTNLEGLNRRRRNSI